MINFLTAAGTLYYLQTYGYLVMFLLMFMEGPIVSYIAAFLASQGIFNIYIVLILALLGNVVGDIGLYSMGRFGKSSRIEKYFKKKLTEKRLIYKIADGLKKKTGKTLMILKLIPPHPAPGIITAGIIEVPFPKFLFYSVITSLPQTLLFVLLGYFTGSSFDVFLSYFHRIEIAILIVVVIILITFIIFTFIIKKLKKYENKL